MILNEMHMTHLGNFAALCSPLATYCGGLQFFLMIFPIFHLAMSCRQQKEEA